MHGIKHGIARGNSMVGVTKDATSGIYVPSTAAEWTTTLAAAGIGSGGPSFIWLMQAASSPIPEVVSGVVTLATSGTAGSFAQSISGWSRVGWTITDAAVGRLLSTNAALPDASTTSALTLEYIAITGTPAAARQVSAPLGSAGSFRAGVNATPAALINDSGNTATGPTTLNTAVHPWVTQYNFTASSAAVYTNSDKIIPTFIGVSGKLRTIGESNGTSPPMWCGYSAMFTGAAAELTSGQIKTLLTTLGWTVAWS